MLAIQNIRMDSLVYVNQNSKVSYVISTIQIHVIEYHVQTMEHVLEQTLSQCLCAFVLLSSLDCIVKPKKQTMFVISSIHALIMQHVSAIQNTRMDSHVCVNQVSMGNFVKLKVVL